MGNTYSAKKLEFHISQNVRDKYQFDEEIFSFDGNVIFGNILAARRFALKLNKTGSMNKPALASHIYGMGLIDEIFHYVIHLYQQQINPDIWKDAYQFLKNTIGAQNLNDLLLQSVKEFPPSPVFQRKQTPQQFLSGQSTRADGTIVNHYELVLEELLLLWLTNNNPAYSNYKELFDDTNLKIQTRYLEMIHNLQIFFKTQPDFGPENQDLVEMLRTPAKVFPNSIPDQLEYIKTRWAYLIGDLLYRLLSSLDFIHEEEKIRLGTGGEGQDKVITFQNQYEKERFSPDREWMPNLVLIAKNIYVWLDQLSKKYQYPITKLDEIPDEELDLLARWGMTGLWLIGLWERSIASKRIKQMRGNPEADASAYSILDYKISADLGGEEALNNLKKRAWLCGIRLASDMVPNHMAIDSNWVINHPERFIALDYSPFPSYSFNGPNLSWDERVGIYLEDHYYDNSDAAVVFKRIDFWSGDEKYIYHGNDGTSMPWNDTAQLDYLKADVREAVIKTIIKVAKQFPIIRFDAAMTLAKKHFQRLWYPEPGSGGDIPSRSQFSMPKSDFDRDFPEEFWREVVDRVAAEVPDTLLLAEAFWLMEGYFVRTLGMHRVYNSAFMNMLRDEKNKEYRQVIKNTIEFDIQILKRYVNFMNNPDERTAVDQFGKGDKYFGVCTLMATMPGLPMFGHGQIEGYSEKYGMEFHRAYWDEKPDSYLVERHEREIAPLLHKRYLFADVENFLFYDFYKNDGIVDENVFAYSNRVGLNKALIVYNNKYQETSGWIKTSAAFASKDNSQVKKILIQKSVGEGLNITDDSNIFTIFHDHVTNLEFIRNNNEIHSKGIYFKLDAYKYHVLLDFRSIPDDDKHHLEQLANMLNGKGVQSIEKKLQELIYEPIREPFRNLVNPDTYKWILQHRTPIIKKENLESFSSNVQRMIEEFLNQVQAHTNGNSNVENITNKIRTELFVALSLPGILSEKDAYKSSSGTVTTSQVLDYLHQSPYGDCFTDNQNIRCWGTLLSWTFIHRIGEIMIDKKTPAVSPNELAAVRIEKWQLSPIIIETFQQLGIDSRTSLNLVTCIRSIIAQNSWYTPNNTDELAYKLVTNWFRDINIQNFLHVNLSDNILWFNKEAFEEFLWWAFITEGLTLMGESNTVRNKSNPSFSLQDSADPAPFFKVFVVINKIAEAEEKSDYQVEKLLSILQPKKAQ